MSRSSGSPVKLKVHQHHMLKPSTLAEDDEARRSLRPRVSLLGKPVPCNTADGGASCAASAKMAVKGNRRKDVRYRRAQAAVYDFLERPKDWRAMSYQLTVFLMVFLCLLLSVFSTVDQYEEVAGNLLYYLELVMVVWFMTEFIFRVWSAGCRSRYQRLTGRLQFIRRPLCLLDIIVTSASIIILCFGSSGRVFATSALRGLRFFQILRMLRMDRRGGSWKLLGSVIWAHRQELFTTLYIGFLGLIFFSFMIYLAEKDRNPVKFGTYPDALWWGVVTLCTVGYGDAVPVTWLGKLIASCCALLGISFFALPAGIMGSGFALKVQQQQRQKHLIRRKVPAAILIQSLWRCYAADENSSSVATWQIHITQPTPKTAVVTAACQKFRANSSFMSRLSIRRREGWHSNSTNSGVGAVSPATRPGHSLVRRTLSGTTAQPPNSNSTSSHDNSSTAAVRMKRNHVSLQDVVRTQQLASQTEVSSKRTLFAGNYKETEIDAKDDSDDNDWSSSIVQLTNAHRAAIRAIRKIKFFVARRVFKEALKPYDVKDVIEQYSAGHLDMLTRIKDLQSRLDTILGQAGSKSADVYESKISLASRVVKVERQVDSIESKLDRLTELYRETNNLNSTSGVSPDLSPQTPPAIVQPVPLRYSNSLHPTQSPSYHMLQQQTRLHRLAGKQLSEPTRRSPDELAQPPDDGGGMMLADDVVAKTAAVHHSLTCSNVDICDDIAGSSKSKPEHTLYRSHVPGKLTSGECQQANTSVQISCCPTTERTVYRQTMTSSTGVTAPRSPRLSTGSKHSFTSDSLSSDVSCTSTVDCFSSQGRDCCVTIPPTGSSSIPAAM